MKKFSDIPEPLVSFLLYIENIQGKSPRTALSYYYDLRAFYKFLKVKKNNLSDDCDFDLIDVLDIDISYLSTVDLNLVYEYMNFLNRERSNSPSSRARKIASIKSYYRYLYKSKLIAENPMADLETIKLTKRLPVHFTLEDSVQLLEGIDGKNALRDYCIITLFLNCGMRLAELVSINTTDIRGDKLTVIGKGDKERTVYLNDACLDAIDAYMTVRKNQSPTASDKNALFLSSRNRRISRRTVQHIVEINVKKLGLDPHKFTTHKLRHTAATLMYQSGVNIRALQKILGHKQLTTTEIYTHVSDDQIKEAVSSHPLSNVKKNNTEKG
ncbi:MAG: tyrosine recombinase XerC [Ruminococcaceae bacterium]|nr:tyrosine recombinase XerC [Oscillospiraceae bacterium]